MALIERLMGEPFEPNPDRKIPVHQFFAACNEVARGARTAAQIRTYYNMDAADTTEFNKMVALVSGNDTAKIFKLQDFHCVLILAEQRVTFYATPAEVRTRLGI